MTSVELSSTYQYPTENDLSNTRTNVISPVETIIFNPAAHGNHRSITLQLFIVFSSLTTLYFFLGLIVLIFSIIFNLAYFYVHIFSLLYQFYIITFCVLAILNELELTEFIRKFSFLQSWIQRGFFYIFVGLDFIQQLSDFVFIFQSNVITIIVYVCGSLIMSHGAIYLVLVRFICYSSPYLFEYLLFTRSRAYSI